jgi:hypothetical protein
MFFLKRITVVCLAALTICVGSGLAVFAVDDISDKISILCSKADYSEKTQVQEALVKIGAKAVEPLIEALKNDEAKHYAIWALAKIRDERAVEPLGEIVSDKNYLRHREALVALATIRSKKALPFFKKALSGKYFDWEAAYLAQTIDCSEENNYFQKELFRQTPNGLEVRFSVNHKADDYITMEVTFRNISSREFVVSFKKVYEGMYLFAQAQDGLIIRSLRTGNIKYLQHQDECHSLKPGETFSASFTGKIIESTSTTISVDHYGLSPPTSLDGFLEIMDFMYPQGSYKVIDFNDTKLDIGILKGNSCRIYFVFENTPEEKEQVEKWVGCTNVWTGKVVSNPVQISW